MRSGAAIKRLALDFDALAADVYWIRALQHYGGDRLSTGRGRNYELLFPLLDLTTTLDPYFNIAYRFGAIFLSEPYPGGPAGPTRRSRCSRKASPPSRTSGSTSTTSRSCTTGTCATSRPRRRGSSGRPSSRARRTGCSRSRRRCSAPGSDRASARFLWNQILQSDEEWLRTTARRAASCSSMRSIAIDQLAGDRRSGFRRRRGTATPGRRWSRRGVLRGVPARSGRHAVRDRSRRPAASRVSSTLDALPDARRRLAAPS